MRVLFHSQGLVCAASGPARVLVAASSLLRSADDNRPSVEGF